MIRTWETESLKHQRSSLSIQILQVNEVLSRSLSMTYVTVAMDSGLPSAVIFVTVTLFGAALAQQFPSGWEPDTVAWGDFPSVPYAVWDSVQPTANQDRSALSSASFRGPERKT